MTGSNDAGVDESWDCSNVVRNLVKRVADRQLRRNLRNRETVAFDASAELRDTRGFISITT